MKSWQLQDAKARLSEVIDTAKKKGPQIITQRGVKTAVIVPFEEWERQQSAAKPGLLDILMSGPGDELPLPDRRAWKLRRQVEL